MAFVPPQFKDFGKKVSDLLKKGFDYKNEVKVVTKSANGVSIETSAVHAKGVEGACKINHKDKELGGEVEVNVSSTGACSATNAKITFDKLIPSGKLSVSGNASPSPPLKLHTAKISLLVFSMSLLTSPAKTLPTFLVLSASTVSLLVVMWLCVLLLVSKTTTLAPNTLRKI